jgi:hypothetical protein
MDSQVTVSMVETHLLAWCIDTASVARLLGSQRPIIIVALLVSEAKDILNFFAV